MTRWTRCLLLALLLVVVATPAHAAPCKPVGANALVEFDRIPMAVRQLHKLVEIGKASDDTDVSFHLYEAARGLIDAIDLKTNFDRSAPIARQYISEAVTFALLGLGFTSAEEAVEYLGLNE